MNEHKDIVVGDKTFVYSYVTGGYVEYIPPIDYDAYDEYEECEYCIG